MRRLSDLYRGSHVRAALLNGLQNEQVGLVAGTENPAAARLLTGADGRYCCTPDAGLANGASVALDDSIDWRDHVVRGDFIRLTSAAQRLDGADAWQMNDPALALAVRRFTNGRLGAGTATPTVLSSTSPTVIVDELASTAQRVFLYADPDDGTLRLHNGSGATLHAELFVEGMSEPESLGEGPAPIPTLTDLLYLGQGLAAALPTVDPEHALETRGVYYASDEGRPYYWTGSAWVAWGGGSVSLSSATPAALGSASAGTGTAASRDDHVHAIPSAADVGAVQVPLYGLDEALPAPTSALSGALYYATDSGRTYACRRTGSSTYAWVDVATGDLAASYGPFLGAYTAQGISLGVGASVGPTGAVGTTLAIGLNFTATGGGTQILWETYNASGGWFLAIGLPTTDAFGINRIGVNSGTSQALGSALSTGEHVLAVAITSGVYRYSIDGGAVGTVSFTGTYTVPQSDAIHLIGNHIVSTVGATAQRLRWVRAWGSALDDAALAAVSAGLSGRPGVSGASPIFAWDASDQREGQARHRLWGSAGYVADGARVYGVDTLVRRRGL